MTEYKITNEKKAELEIELAHRMNELRPAIGMRVKDARDLGDLKENAEYHSSREDQAKNEGRIAEIQEILKYATVVAVPTGGTAGLGSTVVIVKSGDTAEKTYQLVSKEEADIGAGRLSIDSPLGLKLMGSKSGDTIINQGPAGDVKYLVKSVK